jgi:AraC-like DNA-binding protein
MPEDYYTLMFVVECPTQGKAFNLQVDHQDGYMAMYPPGHEVDAYTPEGYSSATLTVPTHLFHEMVEKSFPEIPQKRLQQGAAMRIGAQEQVRLRGLLGELSEVMADSQASATGPLGSLVVQQQLLDAFLMALSSGLQSPSPRLKPRAASATKRLREARDLIAESNGQPLVLMELSERLGMSRRGVELLFRKSLGVGPGKFQQLHRLHGVRRELLTSESGAGRINEVATKWGFLHLGHFSRSYRMLFGENPRDTLARR